MRRILMTGLAAIALAAGPVLAQGQGNDNGNAKGGGNDRGGPSMQGAMKAAASASRSDAGERRGNNGRQAEVDKGNRALLKQARGSEDRGNVQPARGNDRSEVRGPGTSDRREAVRVVRGDGDRGPGNGNRTPAADRRDGGTEWPRNARSLISGCPPGLAAKNNGCRPPGLVRQQEEPWRSALIRPTWWGVRDREDSRYLYDDGYLYRLNDAGSVTDFIPLLGGALGIGRQWPGFHEPDPLPRYYSDYYDLGSAGEYRFADNVIYGVDPATSAITSIAALLTGDDFSIGQPLPPGYDIYNVPLPYRDRYSDTSDALYRYSDGYIYEVDPQTRLIAAAIELLT